ncbi:LuxR C-terminal-related transcriptional regulator [Streptomyces sp. TLI_171]|uniref:helix-turn-helix transcriptional regulator n=1 Tax=Streptomyces sp. TLI_171 TaxID=1938859 RepID=UPI00217D3FAC|nr:LuxR C-terminal-related transcriptional regulator [Streptomyces sp. TLI_171]
MTVRLIADDPITEAGATGFLERWNQVKVLTPEDGGHAEVILALLFDLTESKLARIREAAAMSLHPAVRIVIVSDEITESHLAHSATESGLVLLVRRRTTFTAIRDAVLDRHVRPSYGSEHSSALLMSPANEHVRPTADSAHRGRTAVATRPHTRRTSAGVLREVFPPLAADSKALQPREVEVLRLLAAGQNTAEIAVALSFSQRTIKSIIHDMLTRLNLRNRQHAVAYGIRTNAL